MRFFISGAAGALSAIVGIAIGFMVEIMWLDQMPGWSWGLIAFLCLVPSVLLWWVDHLLENKEREKRRPLVLSIENHQHNYYGEAENVRYELPDGTAISHPKSRTFRAALAKPEYVS